MCGWKNISLTKNSNCRPDTKAMTQTGLFDLTGRTALVTGASSGIGARMAHALAVAGADVILVARRADALKAKSEEIARETGRRAAAVPCDVMADDAADALASDAKAVLRDPDILVNAAGVNLRQPWEDITPETWQQTLRLNLEVPFFLARALVGPMIASGYGRIINIASLQSVRAFPNSMPYGASKGGIAQLTRAMAEAWSPHGVTANAIAPGFFKTELTAPVFENPELAEKQAAATAIGRNGELEDLDGPTVFFASPASAYVTGQVVGVDGGYTAK